MKPLLTTLLILTATCTISPAFAQMGGMSGMPGMSSMREGRPVPACDKTPDPAKCEANRTQRQERRAKAQEQCKESTGADRRKCVRDIMMTQENCANTQNPKRCAAVKTAYESCKDKTGPEFRDCMKAQRPAAASVAAPSASKP